VYEPPAAAWRELPPMPTPRAFAAAVSIGTRIYVLGGVNQSRVSLAVMEEFDVVSGKWRRRADLTTPRNRFAAVAAGGRIFALGGLAETGNLSVTEIYDPVNDRWRPGPELPLARHGHAAVQIEGTLFILGGYGESGGVGVGPFSRVDALNLATGSWERRADLLTARGFFAAVAAGRWVYALGGRLPSGPIERYSLSKHTWEAVGEMPAPRQRFGAALVGGRIIVVGGEGSPREAISYDPTCWATGGRNRKR